MELYPGDKIGDAYGGKCVLFSGSINSYELGITVAHAFDQGDSLLIQFESDKVRKGKCERTIGRCEASFAKIQRRDGGQLTADLAIVHLNTCICSVGNTVWWPRRGENTAFRIKIYEEETIPDHTSVMILDQNGEFQYGCIITESYDDGNLRGYDDGLHDVIGVCASETEEVAITQRGDSGALVMSVPNNERNFLYVYGISIGLCDKPGGKSMTIANSLRNVLREISVNKNYFAVDGTHTIDFAY